MSQNQKRGGANNRNVKRNKNIKGRTQQLDNNLDLGGGGDFVGNGNDVNSSGDVFNSAEEGNYEVVSSEGEEEGGVVNASMLVNLSGVNTTIEERREDLCADLSGTSTLVGGVESLESPNGDEGKGFVTVEGEVGGVASPVKKPDVVEPTGSVLSNEESNLADNEVEKLMSGVVARLPGTVTVLEAPNNVKVYLVGTAHFSQQSHVDVVQTIEQTNPTLVLLELCSSRRNILSLDEETVLKEVSEMNFQKVRLALSNSGAVQGVLHLLLLSMSAQLTKKLGMAPGGEFRAAMRSSRKIPGCVLLLGDRPFNITISRALAALTFFQKIKLGWQFLTSNEDITKEEIERCKEMDAISMLLKEMTGEFPAITEVFVNERDIFLAHSLWLASTSDAHGGSGRERIIVGVVGMGHVPGITRHWGKTTDEAVNQLLRIPETPLSSIILRSTIKICWYGLLGYGLYRIGKRVNSRFDVGKIVGEQVVVFKELFRSV